MGGSTHMGGVGMVKQRWVWYHTLLMAGKTLPSPYRIPVVVVHCRRPSSCPNPSGGEGRGGGGMGSAFASLGLVRCRHVSSSSCVVVVSSVQLGGLVSSLAPSSASSLASSSLWALAFVQ